MTILFLSFLFFQINQISIGPNSGNLNIEVHSLRNNEGKIGIRVFDNPKGFPSDKESAIKEIFVTPIDGVAVFSLENFEFGTYAIGVIHDENENKEFDKNFIGYPKEGFGTSNNPKIFMGPPSFKKAKFDFSGSNLTVKIIMIYF